MPTRKKVVLFGLFALGLFVTASQIVRIQYVSSLTNPMDSGSLILWSTVEANMGIICACIPLLSPLVTQRHNRSTKGTYQSSWGESTNPSTARQSWKLARDRIPSEDDIFKSEKDETNSVVNMGSRESILGKNHIRRDTDIVVTSHIAAAHLANHHSMEPTTTRVGDYESWIRSTA